MSNNPTPAAVAATEAAAAKDSLNIGTTTDQTEALSGQKKHAVDSAKKPTLAAGERLFQSNSPHMNWVMPNGERKKFIGYWYKTKDPVELKELEGIVKTSGGTIIEVKG